MQGILLSAAAGIGLFVLLWLIWYVWKILFTSYQYEPIDDDNHGKSGYSGKDMRLGGQTYVGHSGYSGTSGYSGWQFTCPHYGGHCAPCVWFKDMNCIITPCKFTNRRVYN